MIASGAQAAARSLRDFGMVGEPFQCSGAFGVPAGPPEDSDLQQARETTERRDQGRDCGEPAHSVSSPDETRIGRSVTKRSTMLTTAMTAATIPACPSSASPSSRPKKANALRTEQSRIWQEGVST